MLNWFLNRSLGVKFTVVIIGIILITLSGRTYLYTRAQQEILLDNLKSKSTTLGHFVSLITPGAILTYDFDTMNNYMKEATAQEDVVYSILISTNGTNLTNYLNRANIYIKNAIQQTGDSDIQNILELINQNKSIIAMSFPVSHEGKLLGNLLLGISRDNIDQNYQKSLFEILLSITGTIILLSICIYAGFRLMVIKPISALKSGLNQVSLGNLNHKINIQHNDEIGSLAISFNEMSNQLKQSTGEKDKITLKLQNKTEELHKLHNEELKTSRAKSLFLTNMSHELRTPLNAVIGYSEMLEEDILSDGHTNNIEDLHRIRDAGKHLLALINDVLDLSKVEAGKMELQCENFKLKDIIKEVTATVFPLLKKNKNKLDIKINNTLGVMHSDQTKVRQLLYNLLSNASKFTNNGTITLTAERMTIEKKDWIKIDVIDTGIEIDEDNIDKLFIPFSQIDNSSTRRVDGSGLGLVICKHFCDMMGGSIKLKSQLNIGSTFTIKIPATIRQK